MNLENILLLYNQNYKFPAFVSHRAVVAEVGTVTTIYTRTFNSSKASGYIVREVITEVSADKSISNIAVGTGAWSEDPAVLATYTYNDRFPGVTTTTTHSETLDLRTYNSFPDAIIQETVDNTVTDGQMHGASDIHYFYVNSSGMFMGAYGPSGGGAEPGVAYVTTERLDSFYFSDARNWSTAAMASDTLANNPLFVADTRELIFVSEFSGNSITLRRHGFTEYPVPDGTFDGTAGGVITDPSYSSHVAGMRFLSSKNRLFIATKTSLQLCDYVVEDFETGLVTDQISLTNVEELEIPFSEGLQTAYLSDDGIDLFLVPYEGNIIYQYKLDTPYVLNSLVFFTTLVLTDRIDKVHCLGFYGDSLLASVSFTDTNITYNDAKHKFLVKFASNFTPDTSYPFLDNPDANWLSVPYVQTLDKNLNSAQGMKIYGKSNIFVRGSYQYDRSGANMYRRLDYDLNRGQPSLTFRGDGNVFGELFEDSAHFDNGMKMLVIARDSSHISIADCLYPYSLDVYPPKRWAKPAGIGSASPRGYTIRGGYLYIADYNAGLLQYSWDGNLSNCTLLHTVPDTSWAYGIIFNEDGTKALSCRSTTAAAKIWAYNLSTPFDMRTETHSNYLDLGTGLFPRKVAWYNDELYVQLQDSTGATIYAIRKYTKQ